MQFAAPGPGIFFLSNGGRRAERRPPFEKKKSPAQAPEVAKVGGLPGRGNTVVPLCTPHLLYSNCVIRRGT